MSLLTAGEFFGQVQRTRHVAGFALTESFYTPDLRIPAHSHETGFFYFVLAGASTEKTGGTDREAIPGTLVFHPAGELHANHWHGFGGRCLHLELLPDAAHRTQAVTRLLERPFEARGGPTTWLAARIYQEFRSGDAASSLAIEGLSLELLALTTRSHGLPAERRPPAWLDAARAMIHDRFSEPLSLAEIAAAADVHPSHLARGFREQYRCTPGEYLRRLRLEFACQHLAGTDLPLAEIAVSAGFADQSHFSKVFRRAMAASPAEFRRRCHRCKPETME